MTRTSSARRGTAGRRHGLRVLLWAAAFFAAAQLIGGLVLDHCWPWPRFPQAGQVFARLDALPRTPEIVFIGSSRFEGAVRPEVLDPLLRRYTRQAPRSFNAAVGAGDAVFAEWVLGRMLRAGRRPALLVLEVSPESLNRRQSWLEQHVLRQFTWAEVVRWLPDVCRSTHPLRLLSSRLLPLYVHRYQIRKQAGAAALALLRGAPADPARGESI